MSLGCRADAQSVLRTWRSTEPNGHGNKGKSRA